MRFVLMCQVLADGSPADPSSGSPVSGVQIRWFKDRQELSWPSSGELELIAPQADELAQASSSILFRRVQPEHNGNYTCLATNQLGLSASYSSTLSVKGKYHRECFQLGAGWACARLATRPPAPPSN